MNWMNIWKAVFGRTELFGLNMGFWVSMSFVLIIVVLMNIIFWTMKPKDR